MKKSSREGFSFCKKERGELAGSIGKTKCIFDQNSSRRKATLSSAKTAIILVNGIGALSKGGNKSVANLLQ